ncbi:hypothetical protein [Methylophaga sp. OBS1]|uniref:hypothetical protein n=1 Tax=Methylophaga sp. OBS1 TaxID=2991933 RepID=UPI002257E0C8|nr:hypothetical protein [Methylophaga sp. OBS1]MCX4191489.1 hypothetical protein [Methylophaga sp. OBS1]MCX4191566.1 hypothetical protein [Methylophaga sp. OBS1]
MKSIIIILISGFYLLGVYSLLWVKTDKPSEVQRLNLYQGKILSLKCYLTDKGKTEEYRIMVNLDNSHNLDFYFPHKTCDYLYKNIPSPKGLYFEGYFIASTLMQLKIGGRELVLFDEEKERANIFALYVAIIPFIGYALVKLLRTRRIKNEQKSSS